MQSFLPYGQAHSDVQKILGTFVQNGRHDHMW